MDELTLLRGLRTDLGTPTDAAVERGRERLLRHITPAPRSITPAPRRRRLGLRIALTSAAAAALVTALVAGDVVGFAGWRGAATAEAAEVLDTAAVATIKTSDPVVGPGQYLKVESTYVAARYTTLADRTDLAWLDSGKDTLFIPANRSDEWVWDRSARIPTTFFDAKAKAYAANTIKEAQSTAYMLRGRNGNFSASASDSAIAAPELLASLPRDPYLLLNGIYKRTLGQGQSVDGEALVFIADLLRTGTVPADLRAALYKAAAMIPGVTVISRQAVLDGRTGIAIGRVEDTSNVRKDIIIDPATGLLIGEREVLTKAQGEMPAGTATSSTAVKTSVTTAAPTER